jgi:O-phosphoseryl-tRNA(Cys) synthetase
MKIIAILYRADGQTEEVVPANRRCFKSKELQRLVGGSYINHVYLHNGSVMVVNAEARRDELPLNLRATGIAHRNDYSEPIVGDVLVCPMELIR